MAKWGKTEVERLIAGGLKPVTAPAGFRYVKKDESFVRLIDGGRQMLGVALWNYNPLFAFSLTMTVRLDAAEAIVNQFSGSPPQYHGITTTSLTQLEFLGQPAERGQVEFRASSGSELAAVLPSVVTLVRERVVPFFDEYRNVTALNRGLNPDGAERITRWSPGRQAFDATYHPYRGMAGVTVAHLAGDVRLSDLVIAYRSQMSDMREQDRSPYERLVAYLADQRQAEPIAAPDPAT